MVHFPMPGHSQRLQLWKNGYSESVNFEDRIDLPEIAREYELSGGTIINIVQLDSKTPN